MFYSRKCSVSTSVDVAPGVCSCWGTSGARTVTSEGARWSGFAGRLEPKTTESEVVECDFRNVRLCLRENRGRKNLLHFVLLLTFVSSDWKMSY